MRKRFQFDVQRGTLKAMIAECRRQLVLDALHRHAGDVAGAARELGLARTNLYRPMRRFGIAIERRLVVKERRKK